ncbi:MAG: peptidase S9 [Acidobacteria bacterium RIFCSPLOWO2_02_FULL_67_36]|nr:MAG: peptidase S9 [Acidobacteria bacterium RIFCSPLOWO2_02_FULL_67_36]OFW24403.1 MAG: peptidase S9 [Acidobacteria bacterium RIFCSPLOWO2_12_FULL_66_21]
MLRRTHAIALLFAALPAMLAAQRADQEKPRTDRVTLENYLDLETVAAPQLSPDGTQIIYTRGWIDKMNDRRESALWIMNVDGSRNRFLVKGSGAKWSPSGDRIAYVAAGEPKGSQVFVRWMDAEGATSQVTRVEQSPSAVAWSPDGNRLSFSMLVEERTNWPIKMPKAPAGAKWTEGPRIVERLNYRRDRTGFTDNGYRQIFVVPAVGGTPRQLTSGPHDATGGDWTPEGGSILFSGQRSDNTEYQWRESDVFSVDVTTGAVKQLTTRKGPDGNPTVSPDGRRVAYTGYDWSTDTWVDSKLYVMNIDGSNPHLVSGDWDRSPSEIRWTPDGSALYFMAQDEGAQNLYQLPLAGPSEGKVQPVTRGTHMLTVSDISAKGLAVGTVTTPTKPADVIAFDLKTPANFKQLTAVNDDILAGKKLGETHEIRYASKDGLKIQGWYVTPPDFDPSRKYPLQLHIHGGPHSMYGVGFNFGWQEHAANDYVILYVNPRGSTGYGSTFGNAIKYDYPNKDFDDLMAGVDTVVAKGFVDPQNLFVTGCSGGGVLTAWTVGHTDRFAAASANCPVIDWLSFVGTTDGASWYYNFEKLPWDDPTEHRRRSPLTYVGNVKTPTMLMTGVNDLRTPMPQTEQFYSALKLRKVPTAMLRMNDEWHGTTSTPSNFMRTQLYLRYWFDKYKRPGDRKTTASENR